MTTHLVPHEPPRKVDAVELALEATRKMGTLVGYLQEREARLEAIAEIASQGWLTEGPELGRAREWVETLAKGTPARACERLVKRFAKGQNARR